MLSENTPRRLRSSKKRGRGKKRRTKSKTPRHTHKAEQRQDQQKLDAQLAFKDLARQALNEALPTKSSTSSVLQGKDEFSTTSNVPEDREENCSFIKEEGFSVSSVAEVESTKSPTGAISTMISTPADSAEARRRAIIMRAKMRSKSSKLKRRRKLLKNPNKTVQKSDLRRTVLLKMTPKADKLNLSELKEQISAIKSSTLTISQFVKEYSTPEKKSQDSLASHSVAKMSGDNVQCENENIFDQTSTVSTSRGENVTASKIPTSPNSQESVETISDCNPSRIQTEDKSMAADSDAEKKELCALDMHASLIRETNSNDGASSSSQTPVRFASSSPKIQSLQKSKSSRILVPEDPVLLSSDPSVWRKWLDENVYSASPLAPIQIHENPSNTVEAETCKASPSIDTIIPEVIDVSSAQTRAGIDKEKASSATFESMTSRDSILSVLAEEEEADMQAELEAEEKALVDALNDLVNKPIFSAKKTGSSPTFFAKRPSSSFRSAFRQFVLVVKEPCKTGGEDETATLPSSSRSMSRMERPKDPVAYTLKHRKRGKHEIGNNRIKNRDHVQMVEVEKSSEPNIKRSAFSMEEHQFGINNASSDKICDEPSTQEIDDNSTLDRPSICEGKANVTSQREETAEEDSSKKERVFAEHVNTQNSNNIPTDVTPDEEWRSGENYGWVQYWDTIEDAPYYYNVISGESRWEPPVHFYSGEHYAENGTFADYDEAWKYTSKDYSSNAEKEHTFSVQLHKVLLQRMQHDILSSPDRFTKRLAFAMSNYQERISHQLRQSENLEFTVNSRTLNHPSEEEIQQMIRVFPNWASVYNIQKSTSNSEITSTVGLARADSQTQAIHSSTPLKLDPSRDQIVVEQIERMHYNHFSTKCKRKNGDRLNQRAASLGITFLQIGKHLLFIAVSMLFICRPISEHQSSIPPPIPESINVETTSSFPRFSQTSSVSSKKATNAAAPSIGPKPYSRGLDGSTRIMDEPKSATQHSPEAVSPVKPSTKLNTRQHQSSPARTELATRTESSQPHALPGSANTDSLFMKPNIKFLSPGANEIIHESSFTSHVRVDGSIGLRTRVCLQLSGALSKTFCTDPLPPSTIEEQAADEGRVIPFELGGLTEGTYRLSSLLIGPRKKLAKAVVNFGIRYNGE